MITSPAPKRTAHRATTLLSVGAFCALLSACGSPYDPGARAGSGALIGGGAGAAIGALAGGGRGAAIGALAGGALGAAGGAATTPNRPSYNRNGYYNQAPPQRGYAPQQGYNNGYAAPNYPQQQGYGGYNNGY